MTLALYKRDQQIVTLTLNLDEKRNAINAAMAQELIAGIARAESEGARAVILRANPDARVWCAGHDLGELACEDPRELGNGQFFKLLDAIVKTPLPVIAAVHGKVFAGGVLLVLYSDLAIATADSDLTMTANLMGLPFPTSVYSRWLRVMGLHRVKQMMFTAQPMGALQARECGVYNEILESPPALEARALGLAQGICCCSSEGIALCKLQLNSIAASATLSDVELAMLSTGTDAVAGHESLRQRIIDFAGSITKQ